MKDRKTVRTGIRLTPKQSARWGALAEELGVKRNAVIGILIDSAEIRLKTPVNVQLIKNSDSAKFSQDASAITVS